jgi:hypothetical protein
MAQAAECLRRKHEAPSSNPNTPKKKKREKYEKLCYVHLTIM